ncbi:GNAT family N-acetyltransferase [Candidatus Bipolaricaulota bacterium]|nr:GNAT family N-acetyltransferase [Candidatus Bipolaricaulota bacterium]
MEAFAGYAMDASATKEESMLFRMSKNSVNFEASAGAYNGDHLVGFTLIGIDEMDGNLTAYGEDTGSILTAYDAGTGIIPGFRGHGLAKRMFDHALPGLQERGVKRFLLEVLQKNEPAIKAYQKSEFEITREFRCFVAETKSLRNLPSSAGIEVRPTNATTFERLIPEAEWIPSFENRFTAHSAIPDHVMFFGAYDGDECIGAIAYCQALNWLLSLLVKRSHRRRGVGKSLLQYLATTLPDTVSKLPALNVDGEDRGMQAFFEAVGFSHLIDQYEMGRNL